MKPDFCLMRWFDVGKVPLYYKEDGSLDVNKTLKNFLLIYEYCLAHDDEKFSEYQRLFSGVFDED